VLGETFVPEYPQVPANIPATTPSYQVNIVTDPDVQQKTAQCPGCRDEELCEVDDRQDHPAGPHDEDLHGEQVR
jgi:hypothetical protein